MLKVEEIPFGEFLPDAADFKNPGCLRAHNVIPTAGGYAPFRAPGSVGGAGTNKCRGSALYERSTGDIITVAGSVDRLWVDINGAVTETLTSNIGDSYWQFLRFGARILAVAQNNDMYQLTDLDVDTTWTVLTDPPSQAEIIGEVGQRVVVGDVSGNPYRFEWSALNDPLTWTANATNFNGFAEVDQRYGAITGIAGDRFPALFQEYAVSRISRVGPPSVFRVETIEEARGCIAPASIATVGHLSYFLSHDGFAVTNGAEVSLSGSNRVNRFFLDHVSEDDRWRTHAAIDWANECIVWSYYLREGKAFEGLIIYSWAQDRWSTGTYSLDRLVASAVNGVSLDDLDALYPAGLDSIPVSLDSRVFQAGGRRLSAYLPVPPAEAVLLISGGTAVIMMSGGTGVLMNGGEVPFSTLYAFDGQTLEADFETTEFQPMPGHRAFLNKVYPLVENTAENTEAVVGTRNIKGGDIAYSTRGIVNDAGFCPVRADGRYARIGVTIPAGAEWKKAQGVQVSGRPSGKR